MRHHAVVILLLFSLFTCMSPVSAQQIDLISAWRRQEPEVRRLAVEQLRCEDADGMLAFFLAGLQDDELEVRKAACKALGELRDNRAVAPLQEAAKNLALKHAAENALERCYTSFTAEMRLPTIEECLAELKHQDAQIRRHGIASACFYRDERLTDALIALIADENDDVRDSAIIILAELNIPCAMAPICAAIKSDSRRTRNAVVRALGVLRDPQSLSVLLDAVHNQDSDLREIAVRSLGKYHEPQAINAMISALSDANDTVRVAAAEQLIPVNDPRAIVPLLTMLKSTNDTLHRAAVNTLANITDSRLIEMLIALLRDPDAHTRENAAWTLQRLHDVRAVQPLIDALRDRETRVRQRAAWALGEFHDARAIHALAGLLQEKDSSVRIACAQALSKLGDTRGIQVLIESLRRSPSSLSAEQLADKRREDGYALLEYGVPVIAPLTVLLHDPSASLRALAAEIFGYFESPYAVSPLIGALNDQSDNVRLAAVQALGAIHSDRSTDALITRLTDENADIRAKACRILSRLHSHEAVMPLLTLTADESAPVRKAAIEALGIIGDPRAFTKLLSLLHDTDKEVRIATVTALGNLHNARAYPILLRLAQHSNYLQATAILALGSLDNLQAVAPLLILLQSPTSYLRSCAAEALCRLAQTHNDAPEFLPALEPLLTAFNDRNTFVRRNAICTLGLLRYPSALRPLLGKLLDEGVQQTALNAISNYNDAGTCDIIYALAIGDEEWEVKNIASRALLNLQDARGIEPYLSTLFENDEEPEEYYRLSKLVSPLGPNTVKEVVDLLDFSLNNQIGYSREGYIKALVTLADLNLNSVLLDILRDSQYWRADARAVAAQALGRRKEFSALNLLLATLADPNSIVHWSASKGLGYLGSPAVPALLHALRDPRPLVRGGAAWALTEIKDPRTTEPLLQALHDTDSETRAAAVKALGDMKERRALLPLLARLEDNDYGVRYYARKALESLLSTSGSTTRLEKALHDPDASVRAGAAEMLARGKAQSAGAMRSLLALLNDAHPRVRAMAVNALAASGKTMATRPIIRLRRDTNLTVRVAAVMALGTLGEARVIQPLGSLLTDRASSVRLTAVNALSNIGHYDPPQAAGLLAPLLASPEAALQRATTTALVRIGEPVVGTLAQLLLQKNISYRQHVARVLGKINGKLARRALVMLARDPDPYLRCTAITALGATRHADIVPPLLAALRDINPNVRISAMQGLGTSSDPHAIASLLNLLTAKETGIRTTAARALGELGDPRAIDPLLKALIDPPCNNSARTALRMIIDRSTEIAN